MMEKQYDNIKDNLKNILERIDSAAIASGRDPKEIALMAVTKTVSPELVNIAIEQGVLLLGENRAQEMLEKIDFYHKEKVDIHFIGALQTNKVRQIIDHVSMIQSVDRISLVNEIEKQAAAREKVMDVLIEVNVGNEDSKAGVPLKGVVDFAQKVMEKQHLALRGLMCIPPFQATTNELNMYFFKMRQHLVDIQSKNIDNRNVNVLSMGMSGDFETAIANGATIIRIGSALFGKRLNL